MPGSPVKSPERSAITPLLAGLAAVATVIVVVGLAVALFFNPLWIGFEQERSSVPEITGYTSDQVQAVTGSILADLFFGPPAFAVTVNGQPVLDLSYEEDSNADLDGNIVLDKQGQIIEFQCTAERVACSKKELTKLLDLAYLGAERLFKAQAAALKSS